MAESTIQKIDVEPGVQLAVEAAPDNGKPVLVLSNSIGARLEMWDETVTRLSREVRIVRYDTRGHGRSSVPPAPYSAERLGRDVIGILDALRIPRAVFCGLSLGGFTGMWLGVHASDRLRGLVLANTAPSFPPPSLWHERAATVRKSGMESLVSPTLDRWFTRNFQASAAARVAEVGRMVATTPPEGYAACCEVLAATDLTPELGRISCPVRVIAGAHDPSTTPARGEEIVARIPGADMVVLDAAHISAIEAADAFAQAVREFIARLPEEG